jgi:hypothetical protein
MEAGNIFCSLDLTEFLRFSGGYPDKKQRSSEQNCAKKYEEE